VPVFCDLAHRHPMHLVVGGVGGGVGAPLFEAVQVTIGVSIPLICCNRCFGDIYPQQPYYKCYQCPQCDICAKCFNDSCEKKTQILEKVDLDRLNAFMLNPELKRKFEDVLLSKVTSESSKEEELAIEAFIKILRTPDMNPKKMAEIIAKVCVDDYKSDTRDQIAQQVLREFGIEFIDPAGLMSAITLCRSLAKGDIKGACKSIAEVIVMELVAELGVVVFVALCVVS
jgi:hypothetical protein